MTERKPCVRCERNIDAWAKICPYCNWNQTEMPTPDAIVNAPVVDYTPPDELNLKKKGLYAIGGAVMLVLAFVVGMLINRDGTPKKVPEPIEEKAGKVSAARHAETPLVPAGVGGIEQPITSAPASAAVAGGAANDYQRTDATAVSSVEYAQLAQRASAEKSRLAVLVDPRSLTGAAYAQQPRTMIPPRRTPPPAAAVPAPAAPPQAAPPATESRQGARTRPVPEYQPVPELRGAGHIRLDLSVGADGRVKMINVREGVDRNTPAVIAAVQNWRFRPATENGQPVPSTFSVQLVFGRR